MGSGSFNVSQEAARATLREVRLHGHIYVELREVGRRTIFFCTLCLTPCYSDTSLFDHLRGNLHSRRYAAAKATLFGPVPWPFNDGALFFSSSCDQEHPLSDSVPAKNHVDCPIGDSPEEASSSDGRSRVASVNGKLTNLESCDNVMTDRGSSGISSSTTEAARNHISAVNGQSANRGTCENLSTITKASSEDPSSHTKAARNRGSSENGKSLNLDNCENFLSVPQVSSGDPLSTSKAARKRGSSENGKSSNVDNRENFRAVPRVSSGDPSSASKAARNYGSSENGKSSDLDNHEDFITVPRVSSGPSSATKASRNRGSSVNGKSANLEKCENFITITRVSSGDPSSTTKVRFTGYGHISSRMSSTGFTAKKVRKIWCAWLGTGDFDPGNILLSMPKCDFAVINFRYSYDLGRPCDFDDAESFSSPKKRKSLPTEDEDENIESNKSFRRELRREKRLAAERMCDICGQPMLAGKDVSTLLNRKTLNIACSSRNTHGAFHVFHTSCLIHWILLCESEIWNPKSQGNRGRKGKKGSKSLLLSSILCPECQGTGKIIEDDDLEKPSIPLSQMFQYKLMAIESQKAWMKSPETLEHCSTGLSLSNVEQSADEQVLPLKLLHFYRAV